jgi:hypothetical protein
MNVVAASASGLLEWDLQAIYAYLKALPATTGADDPRQEPARWCAADADCTPGESCAPATGECTGGACASDLDCGTCQTCGAGGACEAPAASSACLASAQ